MFRIVRHARRRTIAACLTLCLVVPAAAIAQAAPADAKEQPAAAFTSGSIADQLGATVVDRNVELPIGGSLTGCVVDPAKLAKFGITGIHEGARLTAFRSAPDKVRLEVDELEPAPVNRKGVARLDQNGKLLAP